MNSPSKSKDGWETCPAGQLQQMVTGLTAQDQLRERNVLVGRVVTAGVLFVVVSGIAIWSTLPRHTGGLTCAQCRSHFAAYHEQIVSNIPIAPESVLHQVEVHLDRCASCQSTFSEMYPDTLAMIGHASCLAGPCAGQPQSAVLVAMLVRP